jgi:hypothetical protein
MEKPSDRDAEAKALELDISDLKMAMDGNPLSKRWQIMRVELCIKASVLATMNEKRIQEAPIFKRDK